ncbi:MAG: S9 family peptidase [Bacteroidia bacterium]
MKKLLVLLLCFGFLQVEAQKKSTSQKESKLNLKDIFASGTFSPKGVYGLQMMPNSEHYLETKYDAATKATTVIKMGFESDKPEATIFNTSSAAGLPKGFMMEGFEISPMGNFLLLQTNSNPIYRHSILAEFYVFDINSNSVKPIANGKQVMLTEISPDETKVAYVSGNNLFVQDLKSGNIEQVTKDGEDNKIINGKTDWVYEEEFSITKGFQWSPEGDKLAYLKFDESKVKLYQLAVYDSLYPTQHRYKYPKAGEDNSVVSLWVYDLKAKQNQFQTTTKAGGSEYMPRFKWKDNQNLTLQIMNRNQNELVIFQKLIDANSDKNLVKMLYEEKSSTYVDVPNELIFLKDGSFLISSEREGYNQVYHYNKDGKQIKKVTADNFDVADILAVDEDKKQIIYSAIEPNPFSKNIYHVNFDGSSKKLISDFSDPLNGEIYPKTTGRSNAIYSAGKKYFILTHSSSGVAPVTMIYNAKGKHVRTLENNMDFTKRMIEYNFVKKEFMDVPLENGVKLSAWMIKPRDFNKKKKYPVLFTIYGGPGHQMVTDQWGGGLDIWYQYLADKGYIVVCVDNRGTGGKGSEFKKVTYKKLGQIESDDQIAAAKYFSTLPYIDGKRIGIYGWSFGGYMSATCLMKGADVFKMAVSVAPVTDWRFYDNIYTERFMQRPQDNKAGYDSTSIMKYVPNLKGKLLLVHGTFDDNVHPQNSMELISEMIRLNKPFDSEFYPDKNHSIYGGMTRLHLYTRITDYILQNL